MHYVYNTRQVVLFHQCVSFCCVVLYNRSGLMIRVYLQQHSSHPKCYMLYAIFHGIACGFSASPRHTEYRSKKQRVVKMYTVSQLLLSYQVQMNRENPAAQFHIAFFHYAIHIKTICSINDASECASEFCTSFIRTHTISLNLADYFLACTK